MRAQGTAAGVHIYTHIECMYPRPSHSHQVQMATQRRGKCRCPHSCPAGRSALSGTRGDGTRPRPRISEWASPPSMGTVWSLRLDSPPGCMHPSEWPEDCLGAGMRRGSPTLSRVLCLKLLEAAACPPILPPFSCNNSFFCELFCKQRQKAIIGKGREGWHPGQEPRPRPSDVTTCC